jgi:hypothetical protein
MDPVVTLGTLMGLGFISGLRLYSTVFAIGLGIRFGFIDLPGSLSHLQVLASAPILAISGGVYLVEFLADKIPWIDSLWDTVHTFIRPLGAAILGATAIGSVDPAMKVGAFLLCGTVALASHSAKAGTRLVANHSPEPVTNIGLSLLEDGLVVGGIWLIFAYPIVALVLVIILLALIIWLMPKLIRLFRRNFARVTSLFRASRPPDGTNTAATGGTG